MMNLQKLRYKFHSGKNSKPWYYVKEYINLHLPVSYLNWRRRRILEDAKKRDDYDYILQRVDYYNKLNSKNLILDQELWDKKAVCIKDQPMTDQKVYFLDTMEYARAFDRNNKWNLLEGDIIYVEGIPTIVKSRPLSNDNQNSVLLKMDKVRHFIFVNDKIPFSEKIDKAIFRGKIAGKDIRLKFFEQYFGNPRFDMRTIDLIKPEWKGEKISIYDHLKYKYILALEGNDVASNLKWIMSSNSIAVMPKPTCETWFMEGTLKPNYHYIEVKSDLSDIEEKMDYYTTHSDEAQAIVNHAHEYVEQFKNKKREEIISLLVLDKYFKLVK